jgi:hypothetical protein
MQYEIYGQVDAALLLFFVCFAAAALPAAVLREPCLLLVEQDWYSY